MEAYPYMLEEYLSFCKLKNKALEEKKLDLSGKKWFYPTELLPMIAFMKNNKIETLLPSSQSVRKYFEIMSGKKISFSGSSKSYLPLIGLTKERKEATLIIERLHKLCNEGREVCGPDAFFYLLSEMIDNIYDHSQFNNSYVFAQTYKNKQFSEIAIMDDGITIEGSYNKAKYDLSNKNAILEALRGVSTKMDDRGFGLRTSVNLFTKGLKGKFLIVSGKEAVYIDEKEQKLFKLDSPLYLQGTLISVRLPYPSKEVNIYEYV